MEPENCSLRCGEVAPIKVSIARLEERQEQHFKATEKQQTTLLQKVDCIDRKLFNDKIGLAQEVHSNTRFRERLSRFWGKLLVGVLIIVTASAIVTAIVQITERFKL